MRARSMARVRDPRARPMNVHLPESPAMRDALDRVGALGLQTQIFRQKAMADGLLTGRPVSMEACRTIAMAEDIHGSLALCAETVAGIGPGMQRFESVAELRSTMIALRWRRRFPKAQRIYRLRSPLIGFGGR